MSEKTETDTGQVLTADQLTLCDIMTTLRHMPTGVRERIIQQLAIEFDVRLP